MGCSLQWASEMGTAALKMGPAMGILRPGAGGGAPAAGRGRPHATGPVQNPGRPLPCKDQHSTKGSPDVGTTPGTMDALHISACPSGAPQGIWNPTENPRSPQSGPTVGPSKRQPCPTVPGSHPTAPRTEATRTPWTHTCFQVRFRERRRRPPDPACFGGHRPGPADP